MSLGGCYKPGKTVGGREQTVRGWGGGERHGVDEIGSGELRRELHERAREGDVCLIWEKMGWDQRVEEEGLNMLGGMRVEEVMTGKIPLNMREDRGNPGVWKKRT